MDPVKEHARKLKSLAPNERDLFNIASELRPATGEELRTPTPHKDNGQIRGILALLGKKLGLFTKVKGGYLRVKPPRHPYRN